MHKNRFQYLSCLTGLGILLLIPAAQATSYPLPRDGNYLIGQIQTIHSREEDTLLDIARRYDLGLNEITAANPQVDPWLPGENTLITLPTQFILPESPWEGLVINLPEMRLYYFPEANNNHSRRTVITHPIGIGRQGRGTPPGQYRVQMKIENPSWTMPHSAYEKLLAEGYTGRRLIPAGPDNPLGKFAIQLNNDGLFIHGTNKPFSIGMRVSNGCIRLYPEDIKNLVTILPNGTGVRIIEQTYKVGGQNNEIFFEAHNPIEKDGQINNNMTALVSRIVKSSGNKPYEPIDWEYVISVASGYTGIPTPVEKPGGIQD